MRKLKIIATTALALPFAMAIPLSIPAMAQDKPAVATPDDTNPSAPVAGKNSFTEEQAKERFADKGYTSITNLMLDDQGVWSAQAMKDGASVILTLDYQGNITEGSE